VLGKSAAPLARRKLGFFIEVLQQSVRFTSVYAVEIVT